MPLTYISLPDDTRWLAWFILYPASELVPAISLMEYQVFFQCIKSSLVFQKKLSPSPVPRVSTHWDYNSAEGNNRRKRPHLSNYLQRQCLSTCGPWPAGTDEWRFLLQRQLLPLPRWCPSLCGMPPARLSAGKPQKSVHCAKNIYFPRNFWGTGEWYRELL